MILVKSGVENSNVNPFKSVDKLVSHLYVRGAAMAGAIHFLNKLEDVLRFFDSGPKKTELQKVTRQVSKVIAESGLLEQDMLSWLNKLNTNFDYKKVELSELSEIELFQNELYWHLKRLSDSLQAFHDTEMNKRHPSSQTVTMVLKYLSEKNLPRAASTLAN